METTTRLLLPEVKDALQNEPDQLIQLAEEMHPADLADLVAELEPDEAQKLLHVLPMNIAARILESCDGDKQLEYFGKLALTSTADAIAITDEMAADDRADLYAQLPEDMRQQLLEAIDDEESHDIRQLLSYPEDTAGALMTTDFVALSASLTAVQAIDEVRRNAAEMETIYQAYAVDPHGTLLGVVSLRDLVTSGADRSLGGIMKPNVVSVDVDSDQEEAARLMAKYDLLSLPVVDRSHRILGIITVDDVIDVVQEEATEDAHKLGAIDPLEAPYLSTPIAELIRKRAPWLVFLFCASMLTETALEHFASAGLEATMMLMLFVPLLASSGGNAGSQSATLVIRAMALGGIDDKDGAKILRRELLVGLVLGAILAALGVGRIVITESTRSVAMAATIGISVVVVVAVANLAGTGVPLALRRLGVDPAVSSTPFIASVVDISTIIIYFEIARLFFV